MIRRLLMSERFDSRVGAEFLSEDRATSAASAIREQIRLPQQNIRIIEPGDPAVARKLEPDSDGIARTMVRTHLVFGGAGLVVGMLLAALLIAFGVQPFAASPGFAFGVISAFGLTFGLLFGGLVGFRPDHDSVIFAARESAENGHWYVVVHTGSRDQNRAVAEILGRYSDERLQAV